MGNLQQNNFVVIIPTFKQEVLFERTLESLFSCVLPEELSKIIIVENGPKGEIENIVNKFSNKTAIFEYVYEKLANKSNALNKVLKNINNTFVVLFDDDIRIDKEVLVKYVSAFKQFGRGYFWGGPVGADFDGPNPPEYLLEYYPHSVKGIDLGKEVKEISEPLLLGCNWAFYSDDLKEISGFDCNFGPGSSTGSVGQETNAMKKLLKSGKRGVYLPGAKVWHYVPEERSDFEWLKERRYRVGIKAGILTKEKMYLHKNFMGIPIWFYRIYFISLFNYYVKRYFILDKKMKEILTLDHNYNRGVITGLRIKN